MQKHLAAKLLTLCLVLSLSACVSVRYPETQLTGQGMAINHHAPLEDRQKVVALQAALRTMHPVVTEEDARRIAHMAVYYPQVLANQYQLTSPPLLHNILVNTGNKPRGLCINWTEDLIKKTLQINPKSMDIYWGVANKGNTFREHSSLVVTAKHQPFSTGILLDPWRHSGKLFWAKVTEDPKYKWKDINYKNYNLNR